MGFLFTRTFIFLLLNIQILHSLMCPYLLNFPLCFKVFPLSFSSLSTPELYFFFDFIHLFLLFPLPHPFYHFLYFPIHLPHFHSIMCSYSSVCYCVHLLFLHLPLVHPFCHPIIAKLVNGVCPKFCNIRVFYVTKMIIVFE